MKCDKCRDEAVLFQPYSGRHLCGRHLTGDIEVRAKRSIRAHRWMDSGDHIAVVISGDKKSGALLSFMKKLTADRHDIRLSAVPAWGAVSGKSTRSAVLKVAALLRIPCLDALSPDGSLAAAQDSITKIALGFSLDDIAQGVLAQFLFGDASRLVHPLPTGSSPVRVICPFIAVPSDELNHYWDCLGTGIDLVPGTPSREGLQKDITAFLEEYSHRHPATKFALLHLGEQLSNGNAAALPFMDSDGCDSRNGMHDLSRFCGGGVTGRGS
jgi:tRNA(Ile)-lysidine synthase TilS/MesJ